MVFGKMIQYIVSISLTIIQIEERKSDALADNSVSEHLLPESSANHLRLRFEITELTSYCLKWIIPEVFLVE
jgi:hypothetical protein